MLGRLIGLVVRNPFGILAAMLVVGSWGAISVNAMWMQAGPHPAPFLGRDALSGIPAKLPPVKPERRVSEIDPGNAGDAEQRRVVEKQMALTRDLQIELARRNFYAGGIDGQFGPHTEAAIRDYERAAELSETGLPSEALLAHVRLSTLSAPPQPVPSPLRAMPVAEQPGADQTKSEITGSLAPAGDSVAALIARAEPVTPQPTPLPAAPQAPTPQVSPAPALQQPAATSPASDSRIKAVQSILADLGYAPGSIDGTLSAGTRRAIEDFEVDRGLPMTGRISKRLLQELTDVSGVPLG